MELITGLGNPGIQYEVTRHNIGFLVIDELAIRNQILLDKKKYHSVYGTGKIAGEKVVLVKPMTYMNLSGKAVYSLLNGLQSSPEDLLVVHDDIDLPLGCIRRKKKGGDAGHKGIRSIIECVESGEFRRLRIGVGRPEDMEEEDVADYLLKPLIDEEIPAYTDIIKKSATEIESIVKARKGEFKRRV